MENRTENLQNCYKQICQTAGNIDEPFEAIELIDKQRFYWKPYKVRVILLAESHVKTTSKDMQIRFERPIDLPQYPNQYARFVYCPAYGERRLTANPEHPQHDGTPQFWKIFFSCINRIDQNKDFNPVQKSTGYTDRIQNKIETLKRLKERGIWLVDTSIVALYDNGDKVPEMDKIIGISWNNYTKQIIQESMPCHVICIGIGVGRIVGPDLQEMVGADNISVIPQPNAHLSAKEHISNFRKYYDICSTKAP